MAHKKRIVRVGMIKFVSRKWNLKYNWNKFEKPPFGYLYGLEGRL